MTTLFAGLREAADPPCLGLLLAASEVERLETIMDDTVSCLAHAMPIWRNARGRQRIVNRRRAASAVQAIRCAAGALAQARRALADQRRLFAQQAAP